MAKFEEVLPEIRKRKYVKRAKWLDSYAFTWGRKIDWCESGFLAKSGCSGKQLTEEDIMANEWEVVIDE